MIEPLRRLLSALCASAFFLAALVGLSGPSTAQAFDARRGISMELWTTWPAPSQWDNPAKLFPFPEWRRTVSTSELKNLKAIGYDFIRLPIDPGVFLAPQSERHRTRLHAEVRSATTMILDAGLNVIVDLHTIPGESSQRPGAVEMVLRDTDTFARYTALVSEMAGRLDGFDHARVAFELINEPIIDCDVPKHRRQWPTLMTRLYAAARVASPTLPLVITGGCWGDAGMLADLPESITTDPNTIYTFHSYVPFVLTHQGAGWAGDFIVHVTGLPYPLDRLGADELERRVEAIKARMLRDAPSGRARELPPYLDELLDEIRTPAKFRALVEKPFRDAASFARKNDIAPSRILLGEFGMIRREYDKDFVMPSEWRIDYMRDVRKIAEEYGFSWSVWGYSGAFGMVTGFGGEPVEGNAAAEILRD